MLIEFSIGNYRSFKEIVTFSMVAANLVAKDKKLDENNISKVDTDLSLLKSAAIYGANASGKSNLARAMSFMKWFMINSSKETQSTEKIDVEPFRLSTETMSKPSYFEIVFLLSGKKYRYGFEVTRDKIISEWFFYVPKIRETKVFERKLNDISFSKFYNANGIQQKTRHNALFLSVSAQFNVDIAEKILNWMTSQVKIISGLNDGGYQGYTSSCLMKSKVKRDAIFKLIKKLDLGIGEIDVKEVGSRETLLEKAKDLPDEFKEFFTKVLDFIPDNGDESKIASIRTLHQKFDDNGFSIGTELFDLDSHESEGTRKIFALSGLLVDSLQEGKTLVIDEFDARLHPLISCAIVGLFNSNETNPNNSQLIFMTHDTNLLTNKLFRRDQIWFAEKNRFGVTDLYSLAEYKVRNDASFETDYIKGRYGAIPYIGNLNSLIESNA
jgi:uncharacterized protein